MQIVLNRYYGGKKKALTLSYDDGVLQDMRLIEIMNKNGIKGTFHLNSGVFGMTGKVTAGQVADIYQGHEISAHTSTHPDLRTCTDSDIVREIGQDRQKLEGITGYNVRGMSYPFGTYSEHIINMLPMLGIEYSRTVQSHGTFVLPDNFLTWHPTCHHNGGALEKLEEFKNPRPWTKMPLFYLWGHSYEFDNDDNWDMIEEFCARAGGDGDTWYATNIELYDYINAVRGLRYSVDNTLIFNPAAVSVWLEADGDCVEIKPGSNKV